MSNYIQFPEQYRALKYYPGYFYNIQDKRLYSIKIQGVLRPLKLHMPNRFNKMCRPFYELSYRGKRQRLTLEYIQNNLLQEYVIQQG